MKKGKILQLVVTVIAVVGASALVRIGMDYFSRKGASFDKQLVEIAQEVNKTCPFLVDQETRLDNAVALPGKTFQYNYTLVNYAKEDLDIAQVEETMRSTLLNNVRSNDGLELFRQNKVTLEFVYKDKSGVFLFSLAFKPEDYQ